MPLYLLRHGETVFNVASRFQGQNDSPLTKNGAQQALGNALKLSQLVPNIDQIHFVSSPLGRTLATSRIICKALGYDFRNIHTEARIMEMNYGTWQGMTEIEIDQEYPGMWDKRSAEPETFTIPGNGESYNDLFKRVDDWISDTRKFWENDDVWVVVSHGGTGSVIRGRYLGLDVHKIHALPRPHDCFYEFSNDRIAEHWQDTKR